MGPDYFSGVSLKRFYELESEYCAIIRQMADSADSESRIRLKERRSAIVVKAREIVRRLNLPKPNWSNSGVDP
jgi:hypothetical protein